MLRRAGEYRTQTRSETFPSPSGGWMRSGNVVMAQPMFAEVLDNFIPTNEGARLRGGIVEFADVGAAVVRMMTYASGATEELFAGTANALFDVGRINGGGSNTFAEVEGLSSGDWSYTQISTAGGQFVIAVNGTDHAWYYDNANWNPIVAAAINEVGFDAETAAFTVGQTVTGGTSGASAEILGITKTSATAGTLKLGAITSGPFQDNEALTDGATGAATADGASASASTVAITNVDTDALSQVWLFKERLFFVEKNTSSVWYLPVESIGGAAVEINLGSVFRKGGSVLFGATWSLDSGSGLDDVCLFVSDRGEIAVYEGTDPSSASTWSLVGVYEIGKPLNKHGFFKAGGDLAILTEDGIIPVSEALKKDRAALQSSAITYAISDEWEAAVRSASASHAVSVTLWQSNALLLVGTPAKTNGKYVSFAANAKTGAWSRITGWDVRCQEVFNDQLYVADGSGKIFAADSGGSDDGVAYTAIWVPKFSYADRQRSANAVGLTYRAPEAVTFDMHAHSDYVVEDMQPPSPIEIYSGSTWGTGAWGTFVWGAGTELVAFTEWQAAYANGYALAPAVVVTSQQTPTPLFEIMSVRLRYETGYAL